MSKTVFIVDDDQSISIALEFLMKKAGYETVCAADGQAAMEYLAGNQADLMVLDVMMPGKNGFDVCREVRSDNRFDSMKILMLTARGREAEMKQGLLLGADAYISKPFSSHKLMEQVRSLLKDEA